MKQSISYWQVAGFLFTSILGTFLHFLFDLSDHSVIAAIFSAVNESIWEHMKLIYYPMFLFSLIEYRFWGKNHKQFWCTKLAGSLFGLTLIPVLYYTYTGIFGISIDWLNITIFFLSAGLVFWVENKLFERENGFCLSSRASFILISMIGVVFTLLTFFTPEIPFFKDPVTGNYGFQKQ